jgi:hypothetical protein
MGGRREDGARPFCTRRRLAPLEGGAPTGELIAGSRIIVQRLVLRTDAAVLGARGQTGAAHPAKLVIARTVPAIGITPAAQGALGYGPVMVFAPVQTFLARWHGRGEW